MGHSHHGHHHHQQEGHAQGPGNTRNIGVALLLNLSFTLIEIVGGLLTNSLAILSDAVHDLGDSLALGMSYYAEKRAGQKLQDPNYTFGLRRLPLISAGLNGLILLLGSLWVVANAVPRLYAPEPVEAGGMMALAVLGVLVNGAAVLKLRGNRGVNSRVVALHLLEDALGWVAVLVGAVIIYYTGYYIIDPILSLLVAAYIFVGAFRNLREVYYLLVQRSPSEVEVGKIRQQLEGLEGVLQITDLHIWSLEGTHHILSLHALVAPDLSPEGQHALKREMRRLITAFGEFHSTIELDYNPDECGDHCPLP
ncbi:cation diffusion facilitator family transporter [Cesiribacter andamanensis]|uniref:Cadmium, cobalt and zinc/H(+)-K(+) antiporter n=1 Tax=Cesiribacter andamanensis AMV16 TaxID=1279009 RepID=M7N3V6_9BACT|nr:cation diffusion facilitator family transporter [Cesiribacter andamanensis]EMR01896.1 Cadmium, cobalt and zinc/H(+)-K(+) antiporter [Cesiribacter andamanensis AMV16]